ncbi:MAG: hypothetical protein RIT44_1892 [Pseudomonadota bacterium]|jgi:hypothetical protein
MKIQNLQSEQYMDRLGRLLSNQLTLATPELPHDISERLRIARQSALAQRKPLVLTRLNAATQANANGSLTAPSDEGLNLWSILASALPLLVLLAGLVTIQWVQQDNRTAELAATDAALLTDELPPDAYTDPGFAQFLKKGLTGSPSHD